MSIHVDTLSFQSFTAAVKRVERPRVLESVGCAGNFYREMGKTAPYFGGGELGSQHKSKYDEDKRVIKLAWAAGIDLIRGNADTMHKVGLLCRIAYLQPRHKMQKIIPSVGRAQQLKDAKEISAFLTFCLGRDKNGVKINNDIVMKHLTVHALNERVAFGDPDYRKKMVKSRRALTKTIRDLEAEYRALGFEILMIREEDALNADDRTLLAHYHILVAAPRSRQLWTDFIKDFKRMSVPYMYFDHIKKIKQFANYVSKPLHIPHNMQPVDFAWYYHNNVSRQKVVRRGSFQAWRRSIAGEGRLTTVDGFFKIVKGNRPFEEEVSAPQERAQTAQDGLPDQTQAEEPKERQRSGKSPVNMFCGVTDPRADIGNVKISYGLMRNYNPGAMNQDAEGLWDLRRAQAHAREAYEKNTGKPFCLREHLKPRARAIYKRMTSDCDIYRSRITVPQDVKAIILDLIENELEGFDVPPPIILETSDPPF